MERDLLTSKASQEKLQRMAADSEARADAASAQVRISVFNSTKKRQHYFDILKAFSSDTHQSIKRQIVTER